MRCGCGLAYLKYVGKPPPPAPTMPAWRMISTASSTLRVFTSSRLRRFNSAISVELDARRGARVVELGGPGDVALLVLWDLIARVDSLHRALRHAHRAVDALVGVDYEVISGIVDAVDGTCPHARRVLRADTRFGYNVGHYRSSSE